MFSALLLGIGHYILNLLMTNTASDQGGSVWHCIIVAGRVIYYQADKSFVILSLNQAAMQSPALRSVLEDIFIVRRVQTMGEALAACTQLAAAFRGAAPPVLYDEAQLCRPVRR